MRRVISAGRFGAVFAMAILLVGPALPSAAYPRPGVTERVSVSSDGEEGILNPLSDDGCAEALGAPSLSKNGRFVAFASLQEGLADHELPLYSDVYVRDLKTGQTEVVSGTNSGAPPLPSLTQLENMASAPGFLCFDPGTVLASNPSISANGRYVAFASQATNIVPGDTNEERDIFVHDRQMGTTTRVSVTTTGVQANGEGENAHSSRAVAVSANGRYVAFGSAATNLVSEDNNDNLDVFIHDMKNGSTQRASIGSDEQEADDGAAAVFAMTPDGRYIVFGTTSDLAPQVPQARPVNSGNAIYMSPSVIYIRDTKRSTTELGPVALDGSKQGAFLNSTQAVSSNGRYIVFVTAAADSVPSDGNRANGGLGNATDIFVLDRETRRTERVSVTRSGEESEEESGYTGGTATISSDGRFVVFTTFDGDLADPIEPCRAGSLTDPGSISPLGSCERDLDLFVHDRRTGAIERVSRGMQGEDLECLALPKSHNGEGWCFAAYASTWDGRHVAFVSHANNLIEGDTNNALDVFVRDLGTPLGAGGLGGLPGGEEPGGEGLCVTDGVCLPDEICIAPAICIPPASAFIAQDTNESSITTEGADLIEAHIAYRPQYADLFVVEELEDMPSLSFGAVGMFSSAASPSIVYGLSFTAGERTYEVRATSLLGGTFGLFDCSEQPLCAKVADLRGGYGTTGERVVFSLPLEAIELQAGGELSNVEAFSAIGTFATGGTKILDTLKLT